MNKVNANKVRQHKNKVYANKFEFVRYAFRPTLSFEAQKQLTKINDDESFSYMTVYGTALKISIWIEGLMRMYKITNRSIIDATAGIGGNTIAFSGHYFFEHVYAVEIDTSRYEKLVKNVKICCPSVKHPGIYNADFMRWYDNKKHAGIPVFIDPPWGGEEYDKQSVIEFLYLNNPSGTKHIDIVDLVEMLLKYHCPLVAVKLPLNFRISRFKICKEFATQHSFIHCRIRVVAFVLNEH